MLVLTGFFISPLMVAPELHDPTRMGKIFFFVRWMLLVIPTGLIACYLNRKQPIDKLSLFVLTWLIWIALRGKTGGIWHDEKLFWLSGCFIFYFQTSIILKGIINQGWHRLTLIPLTVICVVAATEAVLGILQLYGISAIYHSQFKITGTFFNPAPYAGYLVASLPWALLLSTIKQKSAFAKFIYWLGYLSACLILIAIPSTRSRAAYLGAGIVLTIWLFNRYHPWMYVKRVLNTSYKKKLAYSLLPLLTIPLIAGLYLVKKDSASGRLLIWKVAVTTIKERPLTGNGFNTLQATLAPRQACYFASGNATENEKMLAGSVRWAFNEFLQTASEIGLVGLALFVLVVGYALFYRLPQPLSMQNKMAIAASRASLAGILVFGCFSYPFYSLPVTLLFFFSLAVLSAFCTYCFTTQKKAYNVIWQISFFISSILLGVFYINQIPKQNKAYWLWDEAEKLYQTTAYKEANESFAGAYPVLRHNGLFLQQYGKSLSLEEKYPEAIDILIQATNYYNDEFSGITLSYCYQAIGEYAKAEEQYKLAANMVPHKFYPLYLLAKLYHATGQTTKATTIAKIILRKEVKVPSKAIDEIKAEMHLLIDTKASLHSSVKSKGKGQEACTREQTASCPNPSFTRKEVW